MPVWVTAALLVSIPWRWLPSFEVGPLQRERTPAAMPMPPRNEHAPERTTLAPPVVRTAKPVTLPDEVIVRALDQHRSGFMGCWRRALKVDPMLDAVKVKLHVDIDATGSVVAVTHEGLGGTRDGKLGNCLSAVARGLKFSATFDPAVAEFPLFFQPE